VEAKNPPKKHLPEQLPRIYIVSSLYPPIVNVKQRCVPIERVAFKS
jgi:hypothetical protein